MNNKSKEFEDEYIVISIDSTLSRLQIEVSGWKTNGV